MKDTSMHKSFLFISCEEAYHICDKSQYGESTLWEKVKLSLRLIWCGFTRKYVKRNIKLTQTIKSSKLECLQDTEREQLFENFNRQLKNQV